MRRDGHVLNNMNLSSSSDAMRSIVSWCRIVASNEEELSTNWHKHVIHELHYVYEGELQFWFDGNIISCCAGSYIFIPSGIMHSIKDSSPNTKKLVLGFYVVSDMDVINYTFNDTRIPVSREETPTFHEHAQAFMNKFMSKDLITSVSIACIIHTLLLEAVDSLSENSGIRAVQLRESEDCHRIDRILSFINENAFNNITVSDVANVLNLSVRQTTRICNQLFGCSVNQLIIQNRLKQICKLLADQKYSIAEISEMAGFATPYSFSRHFSHYTGVTPSSYRKNYEVHSGKTK